MFDSPDFNANAPENQEDPQSKIHSFDTNVAKACGVNAALILFHFRFWIKRNEECGRNFRDGRYWTYQSVKELCGKFDYLTPKQSRTAIKRLENGGYILKSKYNKSRYNHTTWYAITEAGYNLFSDRP